MLWQDHSARVTHWSSVNDLWAAQGAHQPSHCLTPRRCLHLVILHQGDALPPHTDAVLFNRNKLSEQINLSLDWGIFFHPTICLYCLTVAGTLNCIQLQFVFRLPARPEHIPSNMGVTNFTPLTATSSHAKFSLMTPHVFFLHRQSILNLTKTQQPSSWLQISLPDVSLGCSKWVFQVNQVNELRKVFSRTTARPPPPSGSQLMCFCYLSC